MWGVQGLQMIYLKIPAGHHLFQIWNKTFESQYQGSVTRVDGLKLVSLTLLDITLTVLVPILSTSQRAQACKTSVCVHEVVLRLYLGKNGKKVLFVNLQNMDKNTEINLPCFRSFQMCV